MTSGRPLVSAFMTLTIGGLLSVCQDPAESELTRPPAPRSDAADVDSNTWLEDGGAVDGAAASPPTNDASAPEVDSGLTSDVFGSGGTGSGTPQAASCDYSTPGCDFQRLDGCCSAKGCEHANGADVFNTYPIESCEALIECVQAHPGCSTKDDPLCFGNEAPDAPCLSQGYQASHNDAEGPFAWASKLMACVCGY